MTLERFDSILVLRGSRCGNESYHVCWQWGERPYIRPCCKRPFKGAPLQHMQQQLCVLVPDPPVTKHHMLNHYPVIRLAKSTRFLGRLPIFYHFYPFF